METMIIILSVCLSLILLLILVIILIKYISKNHELEIENRKLCDEIKSLKIENEKLIFVAKNKIDLDEWYEWANISDINFDKYKKCKFEFYEK